MSIPSPAAITKATPRLARQPAIALALVLVVSACTSTITTEGWTVSCDDTPADAKHRQQAAQFVAHQLADTLSYDLNKTPEKAHSGSHFPFWSIRTVTSRSGQR
jgi:hypothetical protein